MNTSNLTNLSSESDNFDGLTQTSCFTSFGIIDLLNPKARDIDEYDIARTLSRIPCFNGLTGDKGSYSVAQHCVLGANAMYKATGDYELALRFLLYDANVAFLGNFTPAIQKCFGSDFSKQLDTLKSKWDEVIYKKFYLTPPSSFKKTYLIREMDSLIRLYELKRFFPLYLPVRPYRWEIDSPVELFNEPSVIENVRIDLAETWTSKVAADIFLSFFHRFF